MKCKVADSDTFCATSNGCRLWSRHFLWACESKFSAVASVHDVQIVLVPLWLHLTSLSIRLNSPHSTRTFPDCASIGYLHRRCNETHECVKDPLRASEDAARTAGYFIKQNEEGEETRLGEGPLKALWRKHAHLAAAVCSRTGPKSPQKLRPGQLFGSLLRLLIVSCR